MKSGNGGEEVEEWILDLCKKVWRGEGWPKDWREGVIVPIVKRGEGERVEEYRGITIAQSAYWIYTTILADRLKREVEEGGVLPPNQTGFRKGVGTIDNVYVLNYLINRQIERKGKLILVFMDLRAAFDSVDRKQISETMRGRGVREGLVKRCEEVLRETVSKVKVGDKYGESFCTVRGVRQGCPLSPSPFTLLLADVEEMLRNGGWGGVKIRGRKTYTLAYADDMVMLAEDEDGMKGLMDRMERYLDGKGLELNTEKTKVMRCRREGGRWKKIRLHWKGKELEEVKEFKYLGYMVKSNGSQEAHIRDRVRKGATLLGQIWGIGKRRFGKDWGRRIWLFDKLV